MYVLCSTDGLSPSREEADGLNVGDAADPSDVSLGLLGIWYVNWAD